ncbi:hypothetical protein OF83DRAFT_1168256 [Amylostereum chailletii]|nr:hypothetical protein OF83DRAFT_1168256 [Amylostereum chailletii]
MEICGTMSYAITPGAKDDGGRITLQGLIGENRESFDSYASVLRVLLEASSEVETINTLTGARIWEHLNSKANARSTNPSAVISSGGESKSILDQVLSPFKRTHWYLIIVVLRVDQVFSNAIVDEEVEVGHMLGVESAPPFSPSADNGSRADILVFDSAGFEHDTAIEDIRRFLLSKWEEDSDVCETRLNIVGTHVKVPCQENGYDCGLFLLHFVEIFLGDPWRHLRNALDSGARQDIPALDSHLMWERLRSTIDQYSQ